MQKDKSKRNIPILYISLYLLNLVPCEYISSFFIKVKIKMKTRPWDMEIARWPWGCPLTSWSARFLIGDMGNKNHNADRPHTGIKGGNGHEAPTQRKTNHLCMVSVPYHHYSSFLEGQGVEVLFVSRTLNQGLVFSLALGGLSVRLKEPPTERLQAFIPAVFGKSSLGHEHKEVGKAPKCWSSFQEN